MKDIKWKTLIITCIVCLLPIFLGVYLWGALPERVAIHFNMYNEPDNFVSKGFAVFGLPILMAVTQGFCCVVNDINVHKYRGEKKFERITKWTIPAMSVILQIITLGFAVGWEIDIRKSAILIVSIVFLLTGNYLPKLDYVKNRKVDSEKARKINRFVGFETVIMGLLGLITIFLPPIASVIWIFLLIPYSLVSGIYAIKVTKEN